MIKEAYYSENVGDVENIPVKGNEVYIQINKESELIFFV
jgi:hypothetical protein